MLDHGLGLKAVGVGSWLGGTQQLPILHACLPTHSAAPLGLYDPLSSTHAPTICTPTLALTLNLTLPCHPPSSLASSPASSPALPSTHWCQPGPDDAMVHILLSLITTHDGNRTRFMEAMMGRK